MNAGVMAASKVRAEMDEEARMRTTALRKFNQAVNYLDIGQYLDWVAAGRPGLTDRNYRAVLRFAASKD